MELEGKGEIGTCGGGGGRADDFVRVASLVAGSGM